MGHTKEWWGALTERERARLHHLEVAQSKVGLGDGGYLPEGYGECLMCSTPCTGSICGACGNELTAIISKADGVWAYAAHLNGDGFEVLPPAFNIMVCGHHVTSIGGSDEGTLYCRECELEQETK